MYKLVNKVSQELFVSGCVIVYFVIRRERWLGPGGWATHWKFCRFVFLLFTPFNGNTGSSVEQHICTERYNGELILSGDVFYCCGFTQHSNAMYNLYYGLEDQPFIYCILIL